MTFTEWKSQAVGRHIDVDGAYGAQCVDVYLDYIQKVIGVSNWGTVSGYGDAAALYPKANLQYFTKFDASGIPIQGDVIFYGATATNSAGHVAVVDSADSTGVTCIEQDGFNPSGSCYVKFRKWNGMCIGWLRPKVTQGDIMNTEAGTELYRTALHREAESTAGAGQWNGQTPAQALRAVRGAEWQIIDNKLKAYDTLQAKVAELSNRPTKDELQTLVQTANTERDKVALLETQLAEEKAKPPVEVVKNPSWLNSVIDFINNLLRSKK
jgi:hypothetical protein